MDRRQEEDVLRITAQYVADVQTGRQPHLSDYLLRYPQYADEIAEFVAYYHAVETDLPQETAEELEGFHSLPQLSETSRVALRRAWERVAEHEMAPADGDMTLVMIAHKQGVSLAELAARIGLSSDIVEKLAESRLTIDAATIPLEMHRRVARVLRQPLSVVQASMRPSNRYPDRRQVAETSAPYHAGKQLGSQVQSFREALEQSVQLSAEQKAAWRNILAREGL
jgi:hypothetical protein